jgi:hypothetical protein
MLKTKNNYLIMDSLYKRKIKNNFKKSIFLTVLIPLFYIFFWLYFYPIVVDEYLLITDNPLETNGFITKSEEIEDSHEINDGKISRNDFSYAYDYYFLTKNGERIEGFSSNKGEIPFLLKNVNLKPYPIKIEYLKNNPSVNRVIGQWWKRKNLGNWFRYTFGPGFLILIFIVLLCVFYIRDTTKKYHLELSKIEK